MWIIVPILDSSKIDNIEYKLMYVPEEFENMIIGSVQSGNHELFNKLINYIVNLASESNTDIKQ